MRAHVLELGRIDAALDNAVESLVGLRALIAPQTAPGLSAALPHAANVSLLVELTEAIDALLSLIETERASVDSEVGRLLAGGP